MHYLICLSDTIIIVPILLRYILKCKPWAQAAYSSLKMDSYIFIVLSLLDILTHHYFLNVDEIL